jgi:hypothetical protein
MKIDESRFSALMHFAGRGRYVCNQKQLLIGRAVVQSISEPGENWKVICVSGAPLTDVRPRLPEFRHKLLAGEAPPEFDFDATDDFWTINIAFNDGPIAVIVEILDTYDFMTSDELFHCETRRKDELPSQLFQAKVTGKDSIDGPWSLDLRLCGIAQHRPSLFRRDGSGLKRLMGWRRVREVLNFRGGWEISDPMIWRCGGKGGYARRRVALLRRLFKINPCPVLSYEEPPGENGFPGWRAMGNQLWEAPRGFVPDEKFHWFLRLGDWSLYSATQGSISDAARSELYAMLVGWDREPGPAFTAERSRINFYLCADKDNYPWFIYFNT